MEKLKSITNFFLTNGVNLSVLNPGSKEKILTIQEALAAIKIFEKVGQPIIGGDVLSKDSENNYRYAYQLWGSEYHSLNWYCNKNNFESITDYSKKSYEAAINNINHAILVAQSLGYEVFFVLIY